MPNLRFGPTMLMGEPGQRSVVPKLQVFGCGLLAAGRQRSLIARCKKPASSPLRARAGMSWAWSRRLKRPRPNPPSAGVSVTGITADSAIGGRDARGDGARLSAGRPSLPPWRAAQQTRRVAAV